MMGEIVKNIVGGSDDQKKLTSEAPKSPWKNPRTPPAAVGDPNSWPPLADAQNGIKIMGYQLGKDQPPHAPTAESGVAEAPPQGPGEPRKVSGQSHHKSAHKDMPMRQPRAGPKHKIGGVPPFPVPFPYHQPGARPIVHTMVPVPHMTVSGYAFHPPRGPPSVPETYMVKPGPENPRQAFVRPVNDRVQTSSKPEPNARDASNLSKGPNVQDHVGSFNLGPRHFMRPPFPGPLPSFVDGTSFSGPRGPLFYYPAAPPGSFGVPYPPMFVPHQLVSGAPMLPPLDLVLRTNIVKQIEYYFSDGNLEGDYYLRSLMDDEGWVAVSHIADFNRVKHMTTDVSLILDSLKTSSSTEVLGDKIRRRDHWSKWVRASAGQTSKDSAENVDDATPSTTNETKNDREDILADGCSLSTAVDRTSTSGANSVSMANLITHVPKYPD